MKLDNLGEPFAVGNTAEVYLFDNKVVKVFKENSSDKEAWNEAYKQEYAHSCGLQVPKVWEVTKVKGRQAIIMEYFNGEPIGDLLSENLTKTEYYIDISIDVQQKIHQKEADHIEPMSEKLSRQIKSAPHLKNEIKAALLNKLNSMTFEKRLCHGDYHMYNLIMSEKKIGIIDWVDASAGDIRADIYRTYLLYSQLSIELAEMYLNLYCKKSGLLRGEILKWAPILAAARLSEGVSTENSDRLMRIVNHYISTS